MDSWQFARTVFHFELPSQVLPRIWIALEFSHERLTLTRAPCIHTTFLHGLRVFPSMKPCYPDHLSEWSSYSISGRRRHGSEQKQSPPVETVQRATAEALLAETKDRCTNGVAG